MPPDHMTLRQEQFAQPCADSAVETSRPSPADAAGRDWIRAPHANVAEYATTCVDAPEESLRVGEISMVP
jgi:hypothetical protein